jgi:hypothetical protein
MKRQLDENQTHGTVTTHGGMSLSTTPGAQENPLGEPTEAREQPCRTSQPASMVRSRGVGRYAEKAMPFLPGEWRKTTPGALAGARPRMQSTVIAWLRSHPGQAAAAR